MGIEEESVVRRIDEARESGGGGERPRLEQCRGEEMVEVEDESIGGEMIEEEVEEVEVVEIMTGDKGVGGGHGKGVDVVATLGKR